MKKMGLFFIGVIAAIFLLASVGPMILLAISLFILYCSVKEFLRTNSNLTKMLWAFIGLAAIAASLSNLPAILGVIAVYILYVIYKKWNSRKQAVPTVVES